MLFSGRLSGSTTGKPSETRTLSSPERRSSFLHGEPGTAQQKRFRRVVVAEPPVEDFYYTPHRGSGLGITTVARICRLLGKKTTLFHFPTARGNASIPLPTCLEHLLPYLTGESGPLSFFTSYRRFGPPYAACAEKIAEAAPDIILLGCFAFCYADSLLELAQQCRERLPNVPIAAGGAGVTVRPAYFEKNPAVDFVLPGEAEMILPAFFAGLEIKPRGGISPRVGDRRAQMEFPMPEDGSRAERGRPLPAASLTGAAGKRVLLSTTTSRGCPKACSFCSVRLSHPGGLRRLPKHDVIENLKSAAPSMAVKNLSINFEDDNLLADWDHAVDVLAAIKKVWPTAAFTAENGLDYTYLDRKKTKVLIDLGFFRFNFSLGVSGAANAEDRNRYRDPALLEELVRFIANKKKQCTVFFICGFPGDTPESSVKTLIYLYTLPCRTGISLYYPVPGVMDKTVPKDAPPALYAGSSAYPWTGTLTTAQMITAFRLSRLSNFLKSSDSVSSGTPREEMHKLRSIPFLDSGMIEGFIEGV